MKNNKYIHVLAAALFALFSTYVYSQIIKKEEGKKMEIAGSEARAIANAYRISESMNMDITKYIVNLSEDELAYTVSFIDIEKPSGFRGSRTGFPQPILKIDKKSGEILEQTFSR